MKRIIFLSVFLFFVSISYAQKDTTLYKHELKVSLGEAATTAFLLQDMCIFNFSVAYYYRPVKWFWIGGNFINMFGNNTYYHWREYATDGSFHDFSKSKRDYCTALAPEIRFSFVNKKPVTLYCALSAGVGWENTFYEERQKKYQTFPYFQTTFFGFSCNVGKNKKKFFLGGECGFGYKSIFSMHGGYRL